LIGRLSGPEQLAWSPITFLLVSRSSEGKIQYLSNVDDSDGRNDNQSKRDGVTNMEVIVPSSLEGLDVAGQRAVHIPCAKDLYPSFMLGTVASGYIDIPSAVEHAILAVTATKALHSVPQFLDEEYNTCGIVSRSYGCTKDRFRM